MSPQCRGPLELSQFPSSLVIHGFMRYSRRSLVRPLFWQSLLELAFATYRPLSNTTTYTSPGISNSVGALPLPSQPGLKLDSALAFPEVHIQNAQALPALPFKQARSSPHPGVLP